jgi:toxin ParE1/3/4
MKPKFDAQAIGDLEQIERHYAERAGDMVAEEFMHRIMATVDRLIARNPRVGKLRTELGSQIRSFPVLPYVVFYQIESRRVVIVRILHGRRDIRPPLASLLAAI